MNIQSFQKEIWDYYRAHKRKLPWRDTKNPYRILVSEIMLQQTQVDRVIPKYRAFLKKFPTLLSLADAPLRDVLVLWQGLGYNRRAKMLHEAAQSVVERYNGKLPSERETLETLPGIGPYTAGAICVFAYNQPSAILETNIRSVYLHFFFKGKKSVSDKEILGYVLKSLDRDNPREWYSALMDYGAMLKKKGNPNTRSKHYVKQSVFKGSDREIRGLILKTVLQSKKESAKGVLKEISKTHDKKRVCIQLKALQREGLVAFSKSKVRIVN